MKITVFTTMPPGVYSGGRYLSLILAYSMARAGAEVTYVTNNAPLFERDFAPYQHLSPIRMLVAPNFAVPEDAAADWVVVIPTGGFNSHFYGAALDYARARGARVALLSFETPNWFAALSPWPRSPMPTEAWRQVVAGGGLVVSIAAEGVEHARAYFGEGSTRGPRRFTHWHPAINDLAAAAAAETGQRTRRSITMFVRTEDPHKGAQDLLRLPPEVFEGHVLSLVFGRGVDEAFVAAVRRHLAPARDVAVEVLSQITDVEKFVLLARSRLLLFPSRFEGYGYPPVEAAYMGVPTVAWDLPLLREVAGEAVTQAPAGDIDAFAAAIRRTLAERPPGPDVRALMRAEVDTLSAGRKMLALLDEAAPHLPAPLAPPPTLAVADGGSGLRAEAARLAAHHSGGVHLYEASASLQQGLVTLAARIEGARKGDVLQIALPVDGSMPPVAFDSDSPQPRRIRAEGQIDAWPPEAGALDLALTLVRGDGRRVALGTVALRPDWPALLAPTPEGGARQPQDAILLADPAELAARPLLAAALCELCAGLQERGRRVTLMIPRDAPPPPPDLALDLLPLPDAVVVVERAALAAALAEQRAAGSTAALPRGLCAAAGCAAEEGLVLDPGGGPEDEVVVFAGGSAPLAGRQAIRPDARHWGRAGRAAAEAPLAVLMPDAPLVELPETVRAQLKRIGKALPGLQLAVPAALCAATGPIVVGPVGRIRPLGPGELAVALRGPGRVVALRLDATAGRTGAAAAAEAMLAAYRIPTVDLADGEAAVAEALSVLVPQGALGADGLGERLAAAGPAAALPRPPRLPSVGLAAVDPPPEPPAVASGGVLGFSATLGPDCPALAAGWADRTPLGARIAQDAGTVVFRLASPPRDCTLLEIMLHLSPTLDPGLAVRFVLNGHLLGTLTRLPAGPSVHRLATREAVWSSGDQVLTVLLSRGEGSNPGSRITLIALSPTTAARVPPLRPSTDDAPMAPLYTAPIAETSGVLGCSLARGAAPGFLRLFAGWSAPEEEFVWSSAPVAAIGFQPPLAAPDPLLLTLTGSTLPVAAVEERIGQRMILRRGTEILAESWIPAQAAAPIPLALPAPTDAAPIGMLFLDFPDAVRPVEAGLGADTRLLGLALRHGECRVLSRDLGRVPMQADARAVRPVLSARVRAAPGLLCLDGPGEPPRGCRFGLARGQTFVRPVALPGGGWRAALPIADEALAAGRLDILCLVAGAQLPLHGVTCGVRTDPPHRQPAGAEAGALVEVTLSSEPDPDPTLFPGMARASAPGPEARAAERLQLPANLRFFAGSPHLDLLGQGWSTPEQAWVWSEGDEAALVLRTPLPAVLLRLEAGALVAATAVRQRVVLSANDVAFATLVFAGGEARTLGIALPPVCAPAGELRLSLPDALRPAEIGMSGDTRKLALQLRGLQIEALPDALLARVVPPGDAAAGIALRAGAPLADGSLAVLAAGPAGRAPFGLSLGGDTARARVIAHALPADGGWQAVLHVTPADIDVDGCVELAVYARADEIDAPAPSGRVRLPVPTGNGEG